MTSRVGMFLAIGVSLGACVLSPIPDMRTPEGRAHELDAKCRAADRSTALPSASAVDAVDPDITYVLGGPNGREARFHGARLRLKPSAGISHESIARALECHQADATLGRGPRLDDDPYVLPGRWLSIEVESAGDGFLVHVRADDPDDARRVLERAKALWLTRHALP